jgi:hypothetical protein
MAEGQELGPKASYIYTSDNGTQFVILRDNDLSLPGVTGLELYTETAQFAFSLPKRFSPRGVHWTGISGNRLVRKFIICGSLDASLYATDTSTPLTIAGTPGFTTGRKGEAYSYVRRSASVPVP